LGNGEKGEKTMIGIKITSTTMHKIAQPL